MALSRRLPAFALAALPAAALAGDYVGTLKVPTTFASGEVYSFSALPLASPAPASPTDEPFRLKLGYQYSPHFAVEGEFNDLPRGPSDAFASAVSPSSPFRSTGFGIDTVATLPVWRFSFYGRMGAYHGDAALPFATYSTSLLADSTSRTRWRYGLGVRYDFTSALGVRAQVEHYSPLGTPFGSEADSDLFSVGVSWRF